MFFKRIYFPYDWQNGTPTTPVLIDMDASRERIFFFLFIENNLYLITLTKIHNTVTENSLNLYTNEMFII
jgi:hypothetical protein